MILCIILQNCIIQRYLGVSLTHAMQTKSIFYTINQSPHIQSSSICTTCKRIARKRARALIYRRSSQASLPPPSLDHESARYATPRVSYEITLAAGAHLSLCHFSKEGQ